MELQRLMENAAKFIKRIEEFESEGPVSVTLIHLNDGRVLGINDECVVLYPSREAFDDSSASNYPTIGLM
jgi:hypothetical protein